MNFHQGTRQKKHSCDNCTGHNRSVRTVKFRNNVMELCGKCINIAVRIAQQDDAIKQAAQEALPKAA